MNTDRFNELLNGPLMHPLPIFHCSRLAMALAFVLQRTGEAGEKALEEFCSARDQLDRFKAGEDDDLQFIEERGDRWSEQGREDARNA
jgi:glycine cleavage system aminomethyltransferase T